MRLLFTALLFFLAFPPAFSAAKKKKTKPAATLTTAESSGCPKTKKDWQARGPKILVEKALRQHAPVEIPDFTAKLGKKNGGASGSAALFRGIHSEMVMVQAKDDESSVYLSGVLRCDAEKHEPVLVSLSYVKGDKSGLVKVIEQ